MLRLAWRQFDSNDTKSRREQQWNETWSNGSIDGNDRRTQAEKTDEDG